MQNKNPIQGMIVLGILYKIIFPQVFEGDLLIRT